MRNGGLIFRIAFFYASMLGAIFSGAVIADPVDANNKKSWLENMFGDMSNCAASSEGFAYDINSGKTYNNIIEANGYKDPTIIGDFAYFKVDEVFFGYKATEIIIPAAYTSYIAVKVDIEAEKLVKNINSINNVNLKIYDSSENVFLTDPVSSYVVKFSDGKSAYACAVD